MATYGYSTPYTGQRQPTLPPGYMEAATAPGRNIAAGIQQFAAGLGQTIQRYRDKKAETEAATQTFETLSGMANQALSSDPQYQALQQYYETGQLPAGVTQNDLRRFETKAQADRSMLNKMAGIGEKFGDMSLAKKKAAIGDMAMVLGQYQNRATEDLKRRQLELSVSEADRAAQQREAERQASMALGQIPTEAPQFQPLPMVEAGAGAAEMQPVQQLPPIQRTPEEIRQSARETFQRLGIAPPQIEALDKLLIGFGKLPMVSTQDVPRVGTLVNIGGEQKLVETKQPSFADITKQRALAIDLPEFKGYAPTEKEASDFREQYANVTQSKKNIGRLIEIANMGAIAQQDPIIKSEAEQLARAAQGALRLDIIGPGTVTDRDRALLEAIVRNPTDIFSLRSSNIKSLTSLLDRAGSGLEAKAKALGIQMSQPEEQRQQPQSVKRSKGGVSYQIQRF